MDFNLNFFGLTDIVRDLRTLNRVENNEVLHDVTRTNTEVMQDTVVERAPERTGKLKKSVVVLTQRSKRRGEITPGVHIREQSLRAGNSDNSIKASDPRNAFYWHFVELGTVDMPVYLPIRPTLNMIEELATQAAIQQINRAIGEVLSK